MNQEIAVPSSKDKSNFSLRFTRHYSFIKPTELYNKWMNPDVNYGLQLKIGYQYCFIICDKYTTLMQDVNKSGNSVQE